MERKLNIWILLGKGRDTRVLDFFSELTLDFDLTAAVFLDDLKNSDLITNVSIKSYIEDPHLSGYLFGVEKDLSSADLLVVCDFGGEVARQICSYCLDNSKPFIFFLQKSDLYCRNEFVASVEAQRALLNSSRGFIVSDKEVEEALDFIGIAKESIIFIGPPMLAGKYCFQSQLREKFRRYIGVCQNDFLLLCEGVSGFEKGALDLMRAMRALINCNEGYASQLKVLFTGNPMKTDMLFHLALDLNLTKNVLILSQDISSFKRDIYSAVDCVVGLQAEPEDKEIFDSWNLIDALGAGLCVLANSDHEMISFLPERFRYNPGDLAGLAHALLLLIKGSEGLDLKKNRERNLVQYRGRYGADRQIERLGGFLKSIISRGTNASAEFSTSSSLSLLKLKSSIDEKGAEEAILEIDSFLCKNDLTNDDRAKAYLWKGQLLLKEGTLEEAMSCFEYSTSSDLTEREAYLGLGYIAYRSFSNDEALSFYRRALSIKPNDAEALAGLGIVYRKAGMPEEAIKWLGQSLLVDCDNQLAVKSLAQCALEADASDYAIEWLEKLRYLVGEQPALLMSLGQLYYRVGENEKGSRLVSTALEFTEKSKL